MCEKKKHLISNPAYRISSYVPFTRNSLQTLLSYRTNVLFYFLGNILRIFVFYFLWKAIFASSGEEVLRGFTLPQMLIYLILTTSVSELSGSVGSDMSDEIGTGQIAMSLIKPISFRLRIYFTSLGDTLYCFIMSGLPGVAAVYILSFVYGIHQELTLLNLLLFFVSLSFSLIIRMSYNFMFSLLGFVTTNMFGLWQVNKAIVQLTSGAVIPLVFFPEAVRKVFAVLPFASLISTPLNIFLGKFSAEEILQAFALQVLWIVIITIAGNIIWKKVVKHLVIQGG